MYSNLNRPASSSKNHIFYNYIYVDPRKPGKYAYPDTNISFLYEPFYVGKGTRGRYLGHLTNSSLNSGTNKYKSRKIKNILKRYTKKEMKQFIILLNFTEDESVAEQTETNLIINIKRKKEGGPLTNYDIGGGKSAGSIHDYKEVYDLETNKYINIGVYLNFNKQYLQESNIIELWNSNYKIVGKRFCKPEDVNEIVSDYNNPYKQIILYTETEEINFIRKDSYLVLGKNTATCLNKLLRGETISNNGYFLTKEDRDNHYRIITIYRDKEVYNIKYADIIKFQKEQNFPDKYNLSDVFSGRQHHMYGFFIDKDKNDEYYKKHILINNTTGEKLYMTKLESTEFAKKQGFKYMFTPIIVGDQNNINGYSYGGVLQ